MGDRTEALLEESMDNQLATLSPDIINSLVLNGDISKLNPQQRVDYYGEFCKRLGLDPVLLPFKILKLNGKETLYCDKGGAAQLVRKHGLSQQVTGQEAVSDIFSVTVRTSDATGRFSDSMGAVPIERLAGEALSNAMMKAHTKAKRRGTLEFLGLGLLDETEVVTIPGARAETITGEPVHMPQLNGHVVQGDVAAANHAIKPHAANMDNAAPLEGDEYTIKKVWKNPKTNAKGPYNLWKIVTNEGLEASTFSDSLGEFAQRFEGTGEVVGIEWQQDGQFKRILDIQRRDTNLAPLPEFEKDVADMPF